MSTTTEYRSSSKRRTMGNPTILVQKTDPGMYQRTRMSMGGPGMISRSTVRMSYASAPGMGGGPVSSATKDSVKNVVQARGEERKQMGELNDKLAQMLGNTRLLEATNKDLMDECERLRKMKGMSMERVREMYQDELDELKKKLEDQAKEIAKVKAENVAVDDKLETECLRIDDLLKTIDALNDKNRKMASENGMLKGEIESLKGELDVVEGDNERLRKEVERLMNDNERCRADERLAFENQLKTAEELNIAENELALLKDATDEEIAQYIELLNNMKSSVPERQNMWKNEFKKVMCDIKNEFDKNLQMKVDEIRMYYDDQVATLQRNMKKDDVDSEIMKTQTKTLKSQLGNNKSRISDLERDLAALEAKYRDLQSRYDEECEECDQEKELLRKKIRELEEDLAESAASINDLNENNFSLYTEIQTYKKLLEGEEKTMQQVVSRAAGDMQSSGAAYLASTIGGGSRSGGGGGGGGGSMQQSSRSESAIRYSQHSTMSGLNFGSTALDGTCVELKNTSRNNEYDLSRWTIKKVTNKGPLVFKFPDGTVIGAGEKIQVFTEYASDPGKGRLDFKANFRSWYVAGRYCLMDEKQNFGLAQIPSFWFSSESTGSVKYNRLSKGPVTIERCAIDGSYVELRNTSKVKDADISGWLIERSHPKGKSKFKMPKNCTLEKGKTLRIFCHMCEDEASGSDLVAPSSTCKTWGAGDGKAIMYDQSEKEEKASLQITYS